MPFSGLTTANAASVVGTSRDSQTNNRRSALLRAGLFDDLRLSTLICWRRTKISASRRALDWNSPMSAPQSNLSSWTIGQQHRPIRTGSPAIWSFRQGHPLAHAPQLPSIESLIYSYLACVQRPFVRRLDDFRASDLPQATERAFLDCQLDEDAIYQ